MNKAIFLEGSLKRHLYNLSLPTVIGLLASMSFSVVDTFFVSKLGAKPLAALSFTFPMFEIMVGFGLGVGIATIAKVGQNLGAKKFHLAKRYATAALLLAWLIGIVVTIVGLLNINTIFHLLGVKPAVMPYVHRFMSIWFWGVVPILTYFACNFILRAYGFVKQVAIISVGSALLNLILDPFLIFGWLGVFPAMGIQGAAWAGLITRLVVMVYAILLLRQKGLIQKIETLKTLRHYWHRLVKVGIPALVTNMIPPISVAITTYLLATQSQEAVAAYGIATKVQWLVVIPFLCLSGALSTVVAQNYGAKHYDRVREAVMLSVKFCLFWGLFIAIILAIFGVDTTYLFTKDPNIVRITTVFFYIAPISFIGWGMTMMIGAGFNAMRYALRSTLLSLLRMLVIYLPLALLLMPIWGDRGIFAAYSTANIIASIVGLIWMRRLFVQYR